MGWLTVRNISPEELLKSAEPLVELSLEEDLASGDITSLATVEPDALGTATFIAKDELVICGLPIAEMVFKKTCRRLGLEKVEFRASLGEGDVISSGTKFAMVEGNLRVLLSAERSALNFLQRLSGIATLTKTAVATVASDSIAILDTRKTAPGYRILEKYAVKCGGGTNHRFGLYDAFLIKNNHIDSLGGDIRLAIERCMRSRTDGVLIEVECRSEAEVLVAVESAPDAILLDNFEPSELRRIVELIHGRNPQIRIEASGGVTLETLGSYKGTGVDAVSLGSLTHSAKAADISMRIHKLNN